MDFQLNDKQNDIIASAQKFAEDLLLKAEGDGVSTDYDRSWTIASEAGYAGLLLPQPYGGKGLGILDTMLVFEALAQAGVDLGFLFSLGVHQFAVGGVISEIGTDRQKDRWLRPMSTGECCGAFAISESGSGSDSFSLGTAAEETESGFKISGEKAWVTNAPNAGVFLLSARSEAAEGAFGISCFIVQADAQGVTVENGPAKSGIDTAPWGTVHLDDVFVPLDSVLGSRGGGAAVFQQAMRMERCGLFALLVGASEYVFGDCLKHVGERQQFGKSLVENPSVAKSLALIKTRIDAGRLLLYAAASKFDNGYADDAAISLAKAYVSESALENALEMQKLYGAIGTLKGSLINRFVNDVQPFRVLSGPNELHYQIATRLIRTFSK